MTILRCGSLVVVTYLAILCLTAICTEVSHPHPGMLPSVRGIESAECCFDGTDQASGDASLSAFPPASTGVGPSPLDIEDVAAESDVSYVVGISTAGTSSGTRYPGATSTTKVTMTSKSGIKFSCALPDMSSSAAANILAGGAGTANAAGIASPSEPVTPGGTVAKLKTKLATAQCLEFSAGYWVYRVCPFRQITQLHREGSTVSMSFDLGQYDPAYDTLPTSASPYTQVYRGTWLC